MWPNDEDIYISKPAGWFQLETVDGVIFKAGHIDVVAKLVSLLVITNEDQCVVVDFINEVCCGYTVLNKFNGVCRNVVGTTENFQYFGDN